MNMQISTRPALDSDKAGIWQLYQSALKAHIETIWGWDEAWQADHFEQAWAAASTSVVEVDGRFAGYTQVDTGELDDYLRMLILLPEWRSHGVGAHLLATILEAARGEGRGLALRVFRTNGSARRFYEREGWQVVADEGDFLRMLPGGAGA